MKSLMLLNVNQPLHSPVNEWVQDVDDFDDYKSLYDVGSRVDTQFDVNDLPASFRTRIGY